jgi:Na+-transporting methylmalonyl-CoA/oxaloacetate decarboxylase gamma subunit
MNILQIDAQTWTITLVGWLIVFTALVLLILVFNNIPRVLRFKFKRTNSTKNKNSNAKDSADEKYISGDETAAIAMALHLYFEDQHDEESNIITIKRIQRRYSPWSSKIYGIRNFPNN